MGTILDLLLRQLPTAWLISVTLTRVRAMVMQGGEEIVPKIVFCGLMATKWPGVYKCHPRSIDLAQALMSVFKKIFL